MIKDFKPLLLCLMSFYFCNNIVAQQALGAHILPQIGDTFYIGHNSNLLSANFYNKHSSGSWNFSFFNIPYNVRAIYQGPSKGKYVNYFKNADMVLIKGNQEEIYYQHIGKNIYILGSVQKSSITKSGVMIRVNSPPSLSSYEGFEIGEEYKVKYKSSIAISNEDLNGSFDWLSSKVDSIKFDFDYLQNWKVEDWGSMVLTQGVNTIQQHIGETDLQFESYVKYTGEKKWTTYSFNSFFLFDDFKYEAILPLTKQINFYSSQFKEALVSVKFSGDEVIDVDVQQKDIGGSIILDIDRKDVLAYPNPSFGIIHFDLLNYPKDYYVIEVYNVIGKKLLTKKIDRFDNIGLSVDLSMLRKGTYLYSLFDSNGQKICTKRLGIITP